MYLEISQVAEIHNFDDEILLSADTVCSELVSQRSYDECLEKDVSPWVRGPIGLNGVIAKTAAGIREGSLSLQNYHHLDSVWRKGLCVPT